MQTGALDNVIILHVLEHVQSLEKSLSELSRVIRPGGNLYEETPCTMREGNIKCSDKNRKGVCKQADHLWDYSCAHIAQRLSFYGFNCTQESDTEDLSYYGIPNSKWGIFHACKKIE